VSNFDILGRNLQLSNTARTIRQKSFCEKTPRERNEGRIKASPVLGLEESGKQATGSEDARRRWRLDETGASSLKNVQEFSSRTPMSPQQFSLVIVSLFQIISSQVDYEKQKH
jgi:hypothetical protein